MKQYGQQVTELRKNILDKVKDQLDEKLNNKDYIGD